MAFNVRVIWKMLTALLVGICIYLYFSIWTFREEADKVGVPYNSFSDVYYVVQWTALIAIVRAALNWLIRPLLVKRVQQVDPLNFDLKKKKIAKEFTSSLWYIFATVYGHIALYDHPYLPTWLLGSGTCEGLILDYGMRVGDAAIKKYFLMQAGHHLYSLVEHILYGLRQPDASETTLHHFCTMSSIMFSYFTNQLAFGATILMIHDYGDILLNLGKFLRDIDLKPIGLGWMVDACYVALVFAWIGPRVGLVSTCVLPAGIYYRHFNHRLENPAYSSLQQKMAPVDALQIFMVSIIMLLNVYWSVLILKIGYTKFTAEKGVSQFVLYNQGERFKAESPSVGAAKEPSNSQ